MNAVEDRPWPQEPAEAPVSLSPALPQPPPRPLQKRPLLAALFSAFPGLGQVYDGLYLRGLVLFLVFTSLIAITSEEHPLFAFGIAFTVLFGMIDAYRQAVLINFGYTQDLGLADLPAAPHAGQGGIVAGALLALIGLVALLERFFVVDLDWLAELWPVGLIAAGLWLVAATVRERRARREAVGG